MEWVERVEKNILPLSVEQKVIKTALTEWKYKGEVYDLEDAYEVCQLCNHENIRYQFKISNDKTGKELFIGSKCIIRFGGVEVLDEQGNALPTPEAKKKIGKDKRNVVANAKTRSVLNSLIELGRVDKDFEISSFVEDYQIRGGFTPKQLFTMIWRLEKFRIPHNKTYFKISIRRPVYKNQLLNMPEDRLRKIRSCLSASQKKLVLDYKNSRKSK